MRYTITKTIIGLICLFLFSQQLSALDDSGPNATVVFNLDACNSYGYNSTNFDYSEFTADISNSDEVTLSVVGNNLYRQNAQINGHSCTPGLNNTEAMCISYNPVCEYQPGNQRAVRFDIQVSSNNNLPVQLQQLSFQEKAPVMFDWIDGMSGANNYPLFYGLRISKNGMLIYEQSNISTTTEWSLQQFDFSDNQDFEVDISAVFNFELLAYCPVGAMALQNVWDLEDIFISAGCASSCPTIIDGATIALADGSTEYNGCVGNIFVDVVNTSSSAPTDYYYVITDDTDKILAFVNSNSMSGLDLSSAPAGECHIWGWSQSGLATPNLGDNISTLNDNACEATSSNFIRVFRSEPNGGTLTGGPFQFCVGDGQADMLPPGSISLTGNSGANSQWIVTFPNGEIAGLPPMPSAVDFEDAGAGTCQVWHISYDGNIDGLVAGANVSDLNGCYSLSNPIDVVRNQPEGGTLTGGPFQFCVGDGQADMLAPGSISLSGNSGANSQWIVTFPNGEIAGLPPMPSAVDFEDAGAGTCQVWHISYDGNIDGLVAGANVSDLNGCYSLSNPIDVVRNQPEGGTLTGGPFQFCVGDGQADMLAPGSISLTGNSGANSQWIVTFPNGEIAGLPPMPSAVDFEDAGAGTCQVWHISYDGNIDGLVAGANVSDLNGCYSLSNPIDVVRNQPEGGTLTGGPFQFCVGDGQADMLAPGSISLSGNSGANSQWIVTFPNGEIAGLPPMPSAVDFEDAGAGTCQVWHISYDGNIDGLVAGANVSGLIGCYSLSNPIDVVRNQPEGGTLTGGPFQFCVGDGQADMLAPGSISLTGNSGANSQWIVTFPNGEIAGLPPMPSAVDFEDAGAGTCQVWHISYDGNIDGLVAGANVSDLNGCYSLSNPIDVVRNQPEGGTLTGGPFQFCVGDGQADMLPPGSISLTGNSGANSQWIVTFPNGEIAGLPPMPSAVDFEDAGPGTCQVWHISYDGSIDGLLAGSNVSDLNGCYSLSNPIDVIRNQPEGGTLTGGPFNFIVDGSPDMVSGISLTGNSGTNTSWVITDVQGNILGLPPMPGVVDFDAAGVGVCLIYSISYENGLTGLAANNNISNLSGCFELSNFVTVNRTAPITVSGGTLTGGPFEFCVDGISDNVSGITINGNTGSNNQWVITDPQGNILGLPPMPGVVDFDAAGPGVCLIWNISYETGLTGLAMGNNVSGLSGIYGLSNSISVTRNQPQGGTLTGGPFIFDSIGDGTADIIPAGSITLDNNSGTNSQWVIADSQGIILGLPPMPSAVDFDGAGSGTCLIWHLSYENGLTGLAPGMSAGDLIGCHSLSNAIEVNRTNADGCHVNGGQLFGGPFNFIAGDGIKDTIAIDSFVLANNSGLNSQWIVTDSAGYILGLPPIPSAVDFDGAGYGNCLVWHLSYETGLTGLEVGTNTSDFNGCYSLSNAMIVNRTNADGCNTNGGVLFGGPFEFCVGDGMADNITAGSIVLANSGGPNSQWVVTDDTGTILGLPPMPSVVDFEGADLGTCLIWHISYENGLTGLAMGNNTAALSGCYNLSNSISVNRIDCSTPVGGIVINEINGNDEVEIKNIGTSSVDVSTYLLCNFPSYGQLSNMTLQCGNDLILEPGELITVVANFDISEDDGELAIYKDNAYSSPNSIIDYIEWGSTDHQRSSVAIEAGIWTTGDFVTSFVSGQSLEYDGNGDHSSDWQSDVASPCAENAFTPDPIQNINYSIYPNPSSGEINIQFEKQTPKSVKVIIMDRTGKVQYSSSMDLEVSKQIAIEELDAGMYFLKVIKDRMVEVKPFIKI